MKPTSSPRELVFCFFRVGHGHSGFARQELSAHNVGRSGLSEAAAETAVPWQVCSGDSAAAATPPRWLRLTEWFLHSSAGTVCDSNFWLELNYLEVAKAAQSCSAHFTALLYTEIYVDRLKADLDRDRCVPHPSSQSSTR